MWEVPGSSSGYRLWRKKYSQVLQLVYSKVTGLICHVLWKDQILELVYLGGWEQQGWFVCSTRIYVFDIYSVFVFVLGVYVY